MLPPSPGFWFHLCLYSGQNPLVLRHIFLQEAEFSMELGRNGRARKELRDSLILWLQVWKGNPGEFPAFAIPLGFLQLPELLWRGVSGNWEQPKNALLKAFPERIPGLSQDTIFLLLEDPVILANTFLNNIVKTLIPACVSSSIREWEERETWKQQVQALPAGKQGWERADGWALTQNYLFFFNSSSFNSNYTSLGATVWFWKPWELLPDPATGFLVFFWVRCGIQCK